MNFVKTADFEIISRTSAAKMKINHEHGTKGAHLF